MHGTEHPSVAIRVVRKFLYSNLSLLMVVLAVLIGVGALLVTPREEEPQIVVPLADVMVSFPGRSAAEVEKLVSTRLEKLLYQIDGVEYVYSMSRPGQAIVTVRFYVGQDREKSLVKLYDKVQQNMDIVPAGVSGWVVKPVEIDDVPVVTMSLSSAKEDDAALRRVAEEIVDRLQSVPNTGRTSVVGGRPRELRVDLRPEALAAYSVSVSQVSEAIRGADTAVRAGDFVRGDREVVVDAGSLLRTAEELGNVVVGVSAGRPVYLRDVARVSDGVSDIKAYVRFGEGAAWGRTEGEGTDVPAGAEVGQERHGGTKARRHDGVGEAGRVEVGNAGGSVPAVTIGVAKKKGTNAVWVARDVLRKVEELEKTVVPSDMRLVVTRNMGVTANHKVNELVEALGVAILIVIALLTVALGWREAFVVAVAVPIVFALTLLVNYLFGYTINRVTLFALILALGLLVDDPIVDVENIHRHFHEARKASRPIVLEAVNEVRPPLIAATIAVILSFLPMFFITGMMGPYMRPMALNVPVTMIMSMAVSFTITPWLAFHVLGRKARRHEGTQSQGTKARSGDGGGEGESGGSGNGHAQGEMDIKKTLVYRAFRPLMEPMLKNRWVAWGFLGVVALMLLGAVAMPALRMVPLKMLPFDNKNELALVLDLPEGTSLERTDAAARAFERYLRTVPEVVAFETYVGTASPMDFNSLVRHYYLRRGSHQADIRIILADKKDRVQQSHALGLRLRDDLTKIAMEQGARLKIVESPPGPPVISTITAEVYGDEGKTSDDLRAGATVVAERLRREAGVVDVDTTVEAKQPEWRFVLDRTKAALNGISDAEVAQTLETALGGRAVAAAEAPRDRNTLPIVLRLPEADRSSLDDLNRLYVRGPGQPAVGGKGGQMVPLAELGKWEQGVNEQTIYHKNLRPVQYVFAEVAGRAPADAILDVQADEGNETRHGGTEARRHEGVGEAGREQGAMALRAGEGFVDVGAKGKAVEKRTFVKNGAGISWGLPEGVEAIFSGEGEWNITLDVFRDLGLAFGVAMVAIYILLVHETGSFVLPVIIMLAIPLTILGVMPGFWVLNHIGVREVAGWPDPVFFTATGMIGMIALAGIVTRDAIILVDFIHHSLARGRNLFDAIMESRVVRLRPILLTAGAAMLGAWPITLDPIFSGLAWSLIFGLLASTLFTLFVIPVSYWLIYHNKPGHGLPESMEEEGEKEVGTARMLAGREVL